MHTQICKDNMQRLLERKKETPDPSYIAGFIDGDGCIFIRKIKDGFQSGFSISQSRTNILQIIRYHFGGKITSSTNRNKNTLNLMENDYYHKYNKRNQYNLLIYSNEYSILLEYLRDSFIIKELQYRCLKEFYKLANLPNKSEEKDRLYNICSDTNNKCILNEQYLSRLNIEYISGLFDAEGCIFIDMKSNKNKITISQKNHPILLHHIHEYMGYGYVYNFNYVINKKTDCLQFIQMIKPYLIVKYNQAIAFEIFLTTRDITKKEEMYKICNKEKHEIEHFTDLNKNVNGKEGYFETMRLRDIKQQICKEIKTKQIYKEKSEKMKGESNHNYGKTFSKETKKKLSLSIREAKNSVSDETITTVRKLISDGYKNIEIQEELQLPRHTVTRIKNGEIICRDEEKKDRKNQTQVEVNLSKRKIFAEEIITVIEKYIKGWKPSAILVYLIDQRRKNNIFNTITIDIIKNIKRNLSNDRAIIYERELTRDRYEYYIQLRENFTKLCK